MDVCVLPSSNWYMSPIKLFEYGAMGRPIIAPRTPAVQEVMRHGEDGWLIEPGCPGDLARSIRYLADHPDTRERLASTFQERVREQYTWQQVAGRVSRLLEQCIEARLSATTAEPQVETAE
jgi:glycosyltransferase involved in cell wall biosynthesis